MSLPALRRLLSALKSTPLHPQWLVLRQEKAALRDVAAMARGLVLDLGCADQRPRCSLPSGCHYLGLDYYPTATNWYGTRPHVFGDAQRLPFATASADCALLLDVLEHLPRPEDCLREIHRVLKPHGHLLLQVPFLYPEHDMPLDFRRWTREGLRLMAAGSGFTVIRESYLGSPGESAGLLLNIAFCKGVLDCIRRRHPGAVLLLIAPLVVPLINVLAWIWARIMPTDPMMASGFRLELRKERIEP